jgi:di/tricarboxylate transporter
MLALIDRFPPEVGMITTLLVTVLVFVAFVKSWAAPDVIALSALVLVILLGALSPNQVLELFSNSAPVTIGAMFILSGALERTGVMEWLARQFSRAAGRSPLRAITVLFLLVVPLSAFANNTPVVVVFLPILMAYARESGVAASKLLMPLSFLAILGGTTTLIGTSTNILVSSTAASMGQEPFGIFEISKLGLLYALIGGAYLIVVGRHLLPDRPTLSSLLSSEDTRSFYSQALVAKNSSLIGKCVPETSLGQSRTVRVFEVRRGGLRVANTPIDQLPLQQGDLLILRGSARDIGMLRETGDLEVAEDDKLDPGGREVRLVEAIIGPHSAMLGRTIRELGLRRHYGVVAAALHRRGHNLLEQFQDIPLQFGDTILFEGPETNLARLREEDDFLSLNVMRDKPFRRRQAPIAVLALVGVVALSALGIFPIVTAALVGAVVVVLARCLDPAEAYHSIDWPILFMIIGMLGLGKALETTGAAAFVAENTASVFGPFGPWAVLAVVYLIATILTEMVTNNAVAIILTPIVIGLAESMGISARPFLVAIMFAASASFCTPIGYQTNTYVFGAGGYKFTDFARVGVPLNFVLFLTAVWLIPQIWPFSE